MKKKITAMLLAICCISSTWTVYADDFSSGSSEVEIEITEDEDADVDDVEITEDADANDGVPLRGQPRDARDDEGADPGKSCEPECSRRAGPDRGL